jgi:MFS transporter, DHA1 family, multidrug resistance protein
VIAVTVFVLGPLTLDLSLPGMGALRSSLGGTNADLQATLTAFLIASGSVQGLYGFIADRFDRRRIMLAAALVYIAGSCLGASAGSVTALLVARVVQAAGSCLLLIECRAMVSDTLEERAAATVFSIAVISMASSSVLSPLIGAFLLSQWGWRAMFGFMCVGGLVCLFTVHRLKGVGNAEVRRIQRPDLFAYYKLLRSPGFVAFAVANGMWFGIALTYATSAPFVYTGHFRLSPTTTAFFLSVVAIGPIVSAQINVFLLRRFSPELLIVGGFCCVTVIAVTLYGAINDFGRPAPLVIALFALIAVGKGLIYTNSMAASLARVPGHRGAASSLLGLLQFLLGAAGSSLTGSFSGRSATRLEAVILGFATVGLVASLLGILYDRHIAAHVQAQPG